MPHRHMPNRHDILTNRHIRSTIIGVASVYKSGQCMINLRIHGDNIVECERAWALTRTTLACSEKSFYQQNSVVAPLLEATFSYGI